VPQSILKSKSDQIGKNWNSRPRKSDLLYSIIGNIIFSSIFNYLEELLPEMVLIELSELS